MSTVLEPGTIEINDIDESQFDDEKNIHLWDGLKSFCGATASPHKSNCPFVTKEWTQYARTTETECPGCGVPICSFCLFLDEERKNNA